MKAIAIIIVLLILSVVPLFGALAIVGAGAVMLASLGHLFGRNSL